MRILSSLAAPAALLAFSFLVPVASAGGLEFLHEKVQIGGRTCMKDHSHSGKGADVSPQAARVKAERDWSEFTAAEYGAAWGSLSLAHDKTMRCGQLRAEWICKIDAVPCRL